MKRNKHLTLVPAVGVAFALLYTLSTSPGHGTLSVPVPAFEAERHSNDYINFGDTLINMSSHPDMRFWNAPVYLPQGATVTKVSFYWNNGSPILTSTLSLNRTPFDDTVEQMAYLESPGISGYGSSETTSIDYAVVDNSQYGYYLTLDLHDNRWIHGVFIEYTYPTGLPLILRDFQEAVRRR